VGAIREEISQDERKEGQNIAMTLVGFVSIYECPIHQFNIHPWLSLSNLSFRYWNNDATCMVLVNYHMIEITSDYRQ